jgi:hypothetical protein
MIAVLYESQFSGVHALPCVYPSWGISRTEYPQARPLLALYIFWQEDNFPQNNRKRGRSFRL